MSSQAGKDQPQKSAAGAAPTYVESQRHRDPAGPHGKNLTEGGFEGSGTAEGALPEPGSKDDPTRVATRDLQGSGKQSKPGGVAEGSWYEKLSDEPA